jgi:hypothetical protein
MADNVTANPGSGGAVLATDDIAGVHYPRSKIVWGPDGTANDTDDAAGKRMPVKIAELGTITMPVSNAGTFATQESGPALTSLQLIDNLVLAEDAAHVTGDPGIQVLAVRRSSAAVSGGTDGDYVNLSVTDNDRLRVEVAGSTAHDAALGSGASQYGVLGAGYASATAPADVSADGDLVRSWHLRNGAQATVITAAGALIGGDATNGLDVDVTRVSGNVTVVGTGTFAVQDSEKVADNAAFTDGTTKVLPVGFILDETAGTALTENDAGAARMDSKRAQVLVIEDETTRGRRATVTASNALKVDGSAVTQPISGTVTANAGTGTFTVAGAAAQDAAISGNPVQIGYRASDAVPSAMSADGDVVYPWANRRGAQIVSPVPHTAGGLSISRVISAASTNATSVKASAGQIYAIYAHNTNAAVRYLKIYNKASAPTVGTDTPVLTLPIPGNTAGAGFTFDLGGHGIAFATGIALALTTGVADSDTGAVAANEIVVNVLYF